jgi:hypothetical protein
MERPVGVTILAVLYFIGAACSAIAGILIIVGGSALSGALGSSSSPAAVGGTLLAMGGAVVAVICLVLAALYFVLGYGFIKLQNWVRILAIICTGIFILVELFGLVSIAAHMGMFQVVFQIVTLAVAIWVLVYLFKSNVKQAFGASAS